VHLTWTALQLDVPSSTCPWQPDGALHWQAGQAGRGAAEVPDFAGTWWSVLAVWPDRTDAPRSAPAVDGAVWHVDLEPVSYRGDAVLSGGARPFDDLPRRGKVAGAAAVVTLAGLGEDPARTGEFFERFARLGQGVRDAPGHRASLVQAPEDGAVLTFSAWTTLRDAVTWAYHRPQHRETLDRHEQVGLVDGSGFLRCAVVGSTGTLHGTDPLAGLTGSAVPSLEAPA
jgi:heme-degrading monooxygenase HmoA